jgi:nucleotide-binding universal stress UspA family protein
MQTIVVGTDGSETANRALREAIELAKQLDAELLVVSAYVPVPESKLRESGRDVPQDLEWIVNPRIDVDATLQRAADEATAEGVTAKIIAREGDAANAILDVADEHEADLIIVGNKGMTGAKRFLMGSVPNKIAHHAPCSVLIVKTT